MPYKLLSKLTRFLDADYQSQQKELDSIVKVTKKLKKKAVEQQKALETATTLEERDEIEAKIKVIEAQRTKALALIQELRSGRKADAGDSGD